MKTSIKNEIQALAELNPGEEICGFIYYNVIGLFIYPCANIATDKTSNFEISADDYIACNARGTITAIYHSHPANKAQNLTEADITIADEMELPIKMFHLGTKQWDEYIPSGYKVKLIGLPFNWGENDCFGLIRNYARQEKGIYIRDYDRDDDFLQSNRNLIVESFPSENYRDIGLGNPLMAGDILLFRSGKLLPQHFAVYIGNTRILHHPINKLSCVEIFSQNWIKRLQHVLRYNG